MLLVCRHLAFGFPGGMGSAAIATSQPPAVRDEHASSPARDWARRCVHPCCAIPFILPFSYLGNIPNQVDLPPHPSEWRQLQRLVLQFSRKASIAGVTLFLEKCPDIPRLKDLVIEWGSWPRKRISCI